MHIQDKNQDCGEAEAIKSVDHGGIGYEQKHEKKLRE
jgi:hypothetical protein